MCKVCMLWFNLLSFRHIYKHSYNEFSLVMQTCCISQCTQCFHLALKFSSRGPNPCIVGSLPCHLYNLTVQICPLLYVSWKRSVTPFFNRLSFTNVSFIEENLDQKRSQKLVLVNTLEQSNELKSYKSSSEISCVKDYYLNHYS